ncbi:MAG: hypothetical protein QME40_06475 [bacterium]|nr:hypothetical protein [bacterium]
MKRKDKKRYDDRILGGGDFVKQILRRQEDWGHRRPNVSKL